MNYLQSEQPAFPWRGFHVSAWREPLRSEEREIISRELSQGHKARYIGTLLGRHHSTITTRSTATVAQRVIGPWTPSDAPRTTVPARRTGNSRRPPARRWRSVGEKAGGTVPPHPLEEA